MKKQPNVITIHGNSAEELLEVAYKIKQRANERIKWDLSYSEHRGWRKHYRLTVEVFSI